MDFSKTKFRASSWGNLLSEPVSKADKEAGKLSLTCQKELIKIYNREVYGRVKDITTKQMDKGTQVQSDSVKLLCQVDGVLYNEYDGDHLENEWFTGTPDIYIGDDIYHATEVHDIKSSYELDSFMPKLVETLDRDYTCQLNVYFDLTGASFGSISYCLVDCPLGILESEKRKLLYSMNVATELAPEYLRAAAELEKLLTFPDIDYRERVIKINVERDDELIERMKAKVPALRKWLQDFHQKHMNLYPKH